MTKKIKDLSAALRNISINLARAVEEIEENKDHARKSSGVAAITLLQEAGFQKHEIAGILKVTPQYSRQLVKGERPWSPRMLELLSERVKTYTNTENETND